MYILFVENWFGLFGNGLNRISIWINVSFDGLANLWYVQYYLKMPIE